MTNSPPSPAHGPRPDFGALRHSLFRRIWAASILSNFGTIILTVGAAWAMTEMTGAPDKVALVQTAFFLPVLIFGLTFGALADLFDRRLVALTAIAIVLCAAATLIALATTGAMAPWALLAFCFLIGAGNALFSPAWQTSIREQVSPKDLPHAISLSAVSYNLARSVGPAIGGIVVAAVGALGAYVITFFSAIPMAVSFLIWRRPKENRARPRERLHEAVGGGLIYMANTRPVRVALVRCFIIGALASAVHALAPIVANNVLSSGANVYGALLAAFGVGAVLGALALNPMRKQMSAEAMIRVLNLTASLGIGIIAIARTLPLSLVGFFIAGAGYTAVVSLLNISVQLRAARWVTARTLAGFQSLIAGGIAIGAIGWGALATAISTPAALGIASAALFVSTAVGFFMPLDNLLAEAAPPTETLPDRWSPTLMDEDFGPIHIAMHYVITPENEYEFRKLMIEIEKSRRRNGARQWSLSQDIEYPERWVQRFVFKNWRDYLLIRQRSTHEERALNDAATALHNGDGPVKAVLRKEVDLASYDIFQASS